MNEMIFFSKALKYVAVTSRWEQHVGGFLLSKCLVMIPYQLLYSAEHCGYICLGASNRRNFPHPDTGKQFGPKFEEQMLLGLGVFFLFVYATKCHCQLPTKNRYTSVQAWALYHYHDYGITGANSRNISSFLLNYKSHLCDHSILVL